MIHRALPRFWKLYAQMPKTIQKLADKNYSLLKNNPLHPSLHFKKINGTDDLWSVRVGDEYRALGIKDALGVVWFWIGHHSDYDKIIAGK